MPYPTTIGGGLMGYPSTVDTGAVVPLALYEGDSCIGGDAAATANTAYYSGFTLYAPAIITTVRIDCAAGGNGHYDVGIYSDNNGAPGTRLANAAATNTSLVTSTAILAPAFINGNLSLSPGRYWLAFWVDNATDTFTRQQASHNSMGIIVQQSTSSALPASAASLSATRYRPMMYGLVSGGWS